VTHAASLGWRLWALGAAAIGLVMVAVYVAIILGVEGDNSLSEALPWIVAMAIPALGTVISVVANDRRLARVVLIGSALVFIAFGLVSIFSIGIGFLVAGVLAGVGVFRMSAPETGKRGFIEEDPSRP
jgi:hypothetical protein